MLFDSSSESCSMFRNILYKGFGLLGSRKARLFEQASFDCKASQLKRLVSIINANKNSIYGKGHGFSSIQSFADFQKAIPVNAYEDLLPYITRSMEGEKSILTEENPFMFATTSGTIGNRKFIPITRAYMEEFRQASVVSGFHLLKNHPGISKGIVLSIFSTAQEALTTSGIPYGAISGRLFLDEPGLIKKHISPIPYDAFVIKDYDTRYYAILRCAIMLPVSCIYTLNPSTIALLAKTLENNADRLVKDIANGTITIDVEISSETRAALSPLLKSDLKRAYFLEKLIEQKQFKPNKIWPELSVIACWTKAAASFYLKDFPQYFGNTPICDITYGASEGRGTVFLGGESQCLAIRSHFYEFIEEENIDKKNPQVFGGWQLETGKNYYILFTTSGGLYRYNLNDVVKVVGWHNKTPLLEFLYKGGNICSFTGEKITETQVTEAVLSTTQGLNLSVNFFTVIPEFEPFPHYELWIEFDHYPLKEKIQVLSHNLDRAISRNNCEYESKRDSARLAPVTVHLLKPGTYMELRKTLVAEGTPDAQIKISHLNPKVEIKKKLLGQLLVRVGS
jgi:hypothetical protein